MLETPEGHRPQDRVAGINLPAFVERMTIGSAPRGGAAVSPGLTSRPSLSVRRGVTVPQGGLVSPGLTSRPSLSEPAFERECPGAFGVAGINLPAFVERTRSAGKV